MMTFHPRLHTEIATEPSVSGTGQEGMGSGTGPAHHEHDHGVHSIHTFGLGDFYDWTPAGQCCFLRKGGSATRITDFDKRMLRDFWRHLKNR